MAMGDEEAVEAVERIGSRQLSPIRRERGLLPGKTATRLPAGELKGAGHSERERQLHNQREDD